MAGLVGKCGKASLVWGVKLSRTSLNVTAMRRVTLGTGE